MILGISELIKLVSEKNLVENLCERELKTPEGAGFDLRLGEVYELRGNGFLGIEDRKTPDIESRAKYSENRRSSFVFKPGEYYLIKTIEKSEHARRYFDLVSAADNDFSVGADDFHRQRQSGISRRADFWHGQSWAGRN
jgi:hypothetical protein